MSETSLWLHGSTSPSNAEWQRCVNTNPTVDKLVPEQAAHDVGAEVNNVLDLPEGLFHGLQGKHTRC